MSQVKERPILFSAPMVRAILEGRKTVTRRAVKGFQIPTEDTSIQVGDRQRWSAIGQRDPRYGFCVFGSTEAECAKELEQYAPCPYGRRGDRLWVRETWARVGNCDPGYLTFGATYPDCLPPKLENIPAASKIRWKPSIHMFRRDSRILLEITDARVERLQDITYEQAAAEGVHRGPLREWCASDEGGACHKYPIPAFRDLWQSVGGNWDANPWVWVVEFKRVTP
ncbi:hypothetical protein [Pseudomonas sp.]|uniref:hypothetical protein n=1 Tax=Pseudomonas sp. TaxID=306 RepID=UPI003FD735C6